MRKSTATVLLYCQGSVPLEDDDCRLMMTIADVCVQVKEEKQNERDSCYIDIRQFGFFFSLCGHKSLGYLQLNSTTGVNCIAADSSKLQQLYSELPIIIQGNWVFTTQP